MRPKCSRTNRFQPSKLFHGTRTGTRTDGGYRVTIPVCFSLLNCQDRSCCFTIRTSMLLQILILIATTRNTWKGLFIFKALCRLELMGGPFLPLRNQQVRKPLSRKSALPLCSSTLPPLPGLATPGEVQEVQKRKINKVWPFWVVLPWCHEQAAFWHQVPCLLLQNGLNEKWPWGWKKNQHFFKRLIWKIA